MIWKEINRKFYINFRTFWNRLKQDIVSFSKLKKGSETEGLYNAALVRSEVDYSMGMTLTRLMTIKTPKSERQGAVRVGHPSCRGTKAAVYRLD